MFSKDNYLIFNFGNILGIFLVTVQRRLRSQTEVFFRVVKRDIIDNISDIFRKSEALFGTKLQNKQTKKQEDTRFQAAFFRLLVRPAEVAGAFHSLHLTQGFGTTSSTLYNSIILVCLVARDVL